MLSITWSFALLIQQVVEIKNSGESPPQVAVVGPSIAADRPNTSLMSPVAHDEIEPDWTDQGDGKLTIVSGMDRRLPVPQLRRGSPLQLASDSVVLVVSTNETGEGEQRRISTEIGTGILVAPCLILTAKHVLGQFQPVPTGAKRAIEVSFHTARGQSARPSQTSRSASVIAWGGSSGLNRRGTLLDDWAILRFEEPTLSIRPTSLDAINCCRPDGTTKYSLIGFPADKFQLNRQVAWVDPDCRVIERLINQIVATNCVATSGNSGGPVLVLRDGVWRVAAILTRASAPNLQGFVSESDNFAIPIDSFLRNALSNASRSTLCGQEPVAIPTPETPPPSLSAPSILRKYDGQGMTDQSTNRSDLIDGLSPSTTTQSSFGVDAGTLDQRRLVGSLASAVASPIASPATQSQMPVGSGAPKADNPPSLSPPRRQRGQALAKQPKAPKRTKAQGQSRTQVPQPQAPYVSPFGPLHPSPPKRSVPESGKLILPLRTNPPSQAQAPD
jgi:V8-like Glu-specific endopeptidase